MYTYLNKIIILNTVALLIESLDLKLYIQDQIISFV